MKRFFYLLAVMLLFCVQACKDDPNGDEPPATPVPPYLWTEFCMGADLSYVNELEDYGVVFKDSSVAGDPFLILKNHGCNTIRVRLWHNPQWLAAITGGSIYSDLQDAEKTIRRAKDLGLAVCLDIHYSDEWADPDQQSKPAAWEGLDFSALKDSVYQYTLNVLNDLKSKNLTPEMVQIGNETNTGMLFPDGKVQNDNWGPLGELLNAGIKAVRDFSAASDIKPRIILHVAQLQNAEWWIGNVKSTGLVTDYDMLGISHYANWSTVNTMAEVQEKIRSLVALSRKQVMIVETAYPWTCADADSYVNIFDCADTLTGYAATREGQYNYLKDLTQAVIRAGGKGVICWEPAWITSSMPDKWGTGSSWDNMTLFDSTGNLLQGADFMVFRYSF